MKFASYFKIGKLRLTHAIRVDSKMHVVWDGFSMETALGHLLQNSSPQKHRQSGIMDDIDMAVPKTVITNTPSLKIKKITSKKYPFLTFNLTY